MKIIEALKTLKMNKIKVADLQNKIAQHCANLSHETPLYIDTRKQIGSWVQSCQDITQENIKLAVAIQNTNIKTQVPISIGDKTVTKSIAEWVLRRREYAAIDGATFTKLGDRGLREGVLPSSVAGQPGVETKIIRHFDAAVRDAKIAEFRDEPFLIDSALEIVNATTDIVDL